MNIDKNSTIGNFLKSKRIQKNLTLDDIFHKTKIRPNMLELIEEERFDQLPTELFLKSFIRSYASAMGIEIKKAFDIYDATIAAIKNENDTVNKNGPSIWKENRIIKIFLIISLIIIACISVPYLYGKIKNFLTEVNSEKGYFQKTEIQLLDSLETSAQFSKNPAPNTKKQDIVKTNPEPEPVKKQDTQKISKRYSLSLRAVETTWLRITADDNSPKEFTLHAGDSLSMYAKEKFNLLIGNSNGIKIKLNNKKIKIPEKAGQVLRLSLP